MTDITLIEVDYDGEITATHPGTVIMKKTIDRISKTYTVYKLDTNAPLHSIHETFRQECLCNQECCDHYITAVLSAKKHNGLYNVVTISTRNY